MPTCDSGGSRKVVVGTAGRIVKGVPQHPVVVKGDVGELRTAVDITDCVHPADIGAQLVVNRDVAPLVSSDPGGGQIEVLSGGEPARGYQHGIGGESLIVGDDVNVVACVIKGDRTSAGNNRDPLALQHAAHTIGDVGI